MENTAKAITSVDEGQEFALPYVEKRMQHIFSVLMETNDRLVNIQMRMNGDNDPNRTLVEPGEKPSPSGMLNRLKMNVDDVAHVAEMVGGNANVLSTMLST